MCGHFAYISSISNSGTLVRMVSWTGMEKYGDFTLPVGISIMNSQEIVSEIISEY